MRDIPTGDASSDRLEYSARPTVLTMMFAAVPPLIVLQTTYVLVTKPVPLPFVVLLVLSVGCLCWLTLAAARQLMPVTIDISPEGLRIERLFLTTTYAWSEISGVKLVPSAGTLADNPAQETTGRLGVGLFLRANDKERAHELLADEILQTGTIEDADQLMRTVERLSGYISRSDKPKKPLKGFGPAVAKKGAQFRRSASAA